MSPNPDGWGCVEFNEAETAINDHILAAMQGIMDLGLRANENELTVAVHGLQAFVIQHMLQRLNPREFGRWYETDDGVVEPDTCLHDWELVSYCARRFSSNCARRCKRCGHIEGIRHPPVDRQ